MSAMWTTITIDLKDVTLPPLHEWPDGFDKDWLAEFAEDGTSPADVLRTIVETETQDAMWDCYDFAADENQIAIGGGSKYETEVNTLAQRVSAVTGGQVTVTEEWTGDGGATTTTSVWGNGERDAAASTHDEQVPDNLPELIRAVRAAIASGVHTVWEDGVASNPTADAASALADALDPQEAK
ncbi:hypothetical protein [Leifsonia shinshuensis]